MRTRPSPPPPAVTPAGAGFTLIEVMVAVVILATAMLAVLSVCVSIQDARLRSLRVQAAALTLGDRLADMTAFGVNRLEARQGTRETVSGDWRWRMDVSATNLSGMSLVRITVDPGTASDKGAAGQAASTAAAGTTVLAGRR